MGDGVRPRPFRRIQVALLAGGAAVFIVSQPAADVGRMAIPLVLFALLCFCNCALISVWEDEVDRSHGQTSLAIQLGRAAAILRSLPWAVALLCVAARLLGGSGAGTAALCGAASAVLLGLVGLAEPRIGRMRARVLADVALMTPVLPLLARHIG
jgi:4-hydroxybenzoate polyprenyltransferase